jgi:hypothetical protein
MRHVRCAKAVAGDPAAEEAVVIAVVDLAGVAAAAEVAEVAAVVAMAEAVVAAAAAAITNEKSASGFWFLVSG